MENDDRRTVFLDVSPSRKKDLEYFKKLGNTMKYPGVKGIDIETPKKFASDLKALENFLVNIYNPANKSQVQEKSAEEKSAPVIEEQSVAKKTPPPVPSKPDYLKEPEQEDGLPAEEPALEAVDDYDILDDLLSDSDPIITNPAHEQQPKSPTSVTKSDPELIPKEQSIPEPDTEPEIDLNPELKEGTQVHWVWQERRRWDHKS
ncbi:hypothetical protein RIR_jg29380.t1 [Rhizophagus irregularis DAOM 181602=DAOM 197198]|nr:hypothetical protein RIR_jg29380.t1 [Rhizophagus irregularis DAOM 181602=DAOM 197198]